MGSPLSARAYPPSRAGTARKSHSFGRVDTPVVPADLTCFGALAASERDSLGVVVVTGPFDCHVRHVARSFRKSERLQLLPARVACAQVE